MGGWKLRIASRGQNLRIVLLFFTSAFVDMVFHMNVLLELQVGKVLVKQNCFKCYLNFFLAREQMTWKDKR